METKKKEEFFNVNLSMYIYLEKHIEVVNIYGQKVGFNADEYIVTDSDFWQIKKIFKSKTEALRYIAHLLDAETKSEYNHYKWCIDYGLEEGSIIQFEDGKKGCILGKEYTDGCLKYSPIKKDGTVGKAIRNLYGNLNFIVIENPVED